MHQPIISRRPLEGKTVVITGASSGVGRAAAEAFALEGCNVVAAARGKEGLEQTVRLCHDLGTICIGVQTDVSDYEQVKQLAERAKEFNGRIDIWVNNAGVMASGKFEEIPMEVNEQVIRTNLFGYMNGAYTALPVFRAQGEGILINNVSIGGFMPAPYSAVYSATKFGIRGMMEGLHGEISDLKNVHICNIYPQIQRSTGNMHSAKYSGLKFKIPPLASDPRATAEAMVKLAKKPRKDTYPDAMSLILPTVYSMFPKTITNAASAGMRLMMNDKTPPTSGNILQPSGEPRKIYGETILPVASRKTKTAALAVLGAGLAFLIMRKK